MRHRSVVLSSALLALVPAASAHGAAPWSAPQTLTDAATRVAGAPAVLWSPGAGTIVPFGIQAAAPPSPSNLALARRPVAAPVFGAPSVTTTRSDATRVMTYGTSRVVVVSQGATQLRARFGSAFGRLGPSRVVSGSSDVLRYSAAANDRGDVVIAFIAQHRSLLQDVVVVRRRAGHGFGAPEAIVGHGRVHQLATAINAAGDIVVAYDRQGRVLARGRPARGSWQPADDVAATAASNPHLRVALGSGGRAVIGIFEQALSEGGDNGPANVIAAVRRPGHRFGAPQLLESFAERFPDFFGTPGSAEVAVDGDGALVAWTGRVGGSFGVRVAALTGSRFGAPLSASPAGQQLDALAVGDGGRATVVWSQVATDPAPPTATIGAAVRASRSTAFGPPELVSGVEAGARQAAVGYAPHSGPATVAWLASTGPSSTGVRVATRATP
ncbi:MAG: hypothetical protein QOJ89_251 [bacterium]|jgi:YD repeat-containing protein